MRNKKILIVEDEPFFSKYIKQLLVKENYEVLGIVENGLDSISFSRQYKPDLILMDVMLNGSMSGCEAAVEIHQRDKSIKIIFLTAYAEKEMIEYAVNADATAYLLKPYRDDEILATIKLMFAHEEHLVHVEDKENISLRYGYTFNTKSHRLLKENREIHLGKKLLKLIEILVENKNISVSNAQLCTYIWGEPKNDKTLRSLVYRIRMLLKSDIIENVNGLGYKIV